MSDKPAAARAVPPRPGRYPMSYEQESLWLDDHLARGPSRYLESWACRLTGQLDVPAAEWAIGQVVERHEVLRSRLVLEADRLVQVVSDPGQVQITQRSCSPAALAAELSWIVAQPLDLGVAPLRPWLVRLAPADHVLMVQFHHAVVDDWALAVFEQEFRALYRAHVLGAALALEPLPVQAGEHAAAQRAAGIDPADLAYWQQRVSGFGIPSTVPTDRPRPESPSHSGEQLRFDLSSETGREIQRASRARRTTPYTVFAAAMAAVLRLQSGQQDIVFGTPVSRRGSAAVDGMIGCLTDLLPLRLTVGGDASLAGLIDQAKSAVLGALQHKDVPYAALLRHARRGPGSGPRSLCPTALVVDDAGHSGVSLPGLTAHRLYVPTGRAKFDLCLTLVRKDDGGYLGMCDYAAELYNAATVDRVTAQFTDVLTSGIAAIDQPLCSVLANRQVNIRA